MKPELGITLYVKDTKELKEATVITVGKKFFTLKALNGWQEWKVEFTSFDGGKWYTYNPEYTQHRKTVYQDKQVYLDECEATELWSFAKSKFQSVYTCPYSLEKLRKIKAVLEEEV